MSFKVGDAVIKKGETLWSTITKIVCTLEDGRVVESKDLTIAIDTKPRNVTNNGVYIHPRSWPTEDDKLSFNTKL